VDTEHELNMNKTLEQDLASREAEVELPWKSLRNLEKANSSFQAELTSIETKIMRFEDDKNDLESQIVAEVP